MQFGSRNDDNENYQQCCDPKGAFGLALQVVARLIAIVLGPANIG
jgi:hypothetical protein